MNYSARLRDPRWRAKREEVFAARGRRCERCGNLSELQIHHLQYRRGRLPWEYPIRDLQVVCRSCHEDEHPRQTLRLRIDRRLAELAHSTTPENRSERDALLAARRSLEGK